MKVEKGKVKSWREKHKNTFGEEKKIIWEKVSRREEDLIRFSKGEIFEELWGEYQRIKMEYLEAVAQGCKWGERRNILNEMADLVGGDDRKAFLMLDLYK